MLRTLLFVKLLLVHHSTQSPVAVQAECPHNVTLQCPYDDLQDGNFLSIIWYKLIDERPNGIAKRKKNQIKVDHFEFSRPAGITPGYGLELPGVTPNDSGIYQCSVRADVGGKNQDLPVNLTVRECPTPVSTTPPTSCDAKDKELPVMWTVMGYLAVGLVKVTLSLISILVIHFISRRKKRMQ